MPVDVSDHLHLRETPFIDGNVKIVYFSDHKNIVVFIKL